MYCKHCGTKITFDAKYCQNCGLKIRLTVKEQYYLKKELPINSLDDELITKEEKIIVNYKNTTSNDKKESVLDTNLHPWRRFFARIFDIYTLGILMILIVSFLVGYNHPNYVDTFLEIVKNPILAGILYYIIWLQLEAILIASYGTTPGKWLFGIKVLNDKKEKLSYKNSLKRSVLVWVQGESFGMPFIMLITRYFAYRRLLKTNTTLWDEEVNSIVVHKKWGMLRYIITILAMFILLIIFTIINTDYS